MAQEYVEVITAEGQVIPFAVEAYDGPIPASRIRDGITRRTMNTLDGGIEVVKAIAEAVKRNVGGLPDPPHRISTEVGLTVTSDANFVVAASSAEAHIIIRLDWEGSHSDGEAARAGSSAVN